jgi:hypothetical protein
MRKFWIILVLVICTAFIFSENLQAGHFGPPEPSAKDTSGGWKAGVGYFFYQDKVGSDDAFNKIQQNQIYLELSKTIARYFELYLRFGGADVTGKDIFVSDSTVTFNKNDFDGDWKPFETLGAKGFYPLSSMFGVGAFVQGTYYFGTYKDSLTGTIGGIPFSAEFKFNDWWNFTCGAALQAKFPHDILIYAGPYFHWTEITAGSTISALGNTYANEDSTLRNESHVGGYFGFVLPISREFRFNLEGQYSKEFSAGIMVSYSF